MYRIIKTMRGESILRTNGDGSITSIPTDPLNTDYQEYLTWVTQGNTPEYTDITE